MNDTPDKHGLLSAFDLGPSWARDEAPARKYDDHRGEEPGGRRGRSGDPQRGGGRREGGGGRGDFRERRDGGGRGRGGRDARGDGGAGERHREMPAPAKGVRVTIEPDPEAVKRVVKEIHHVARVYSLFDISQLLLAARERCRLHITADDRAGMMWRGRHDDSLFLTREEAVAHFWQNGPVDEFYETEETEVEAPTGNFQVVARCGISGEWLGPPNFHSYQANLRRLHRERFANMDFDRYSAKVRTERGEEAVNAWLETMKVRRRWRPKGGDDESWSFDRSTVERDFSTHRFADVFEEVREARLPGNVPGFHLSSGILAAVKLAGNHARRHPAMLIPTICKMLESEHLAVFKKQGKLFSGPARPHPLPADAVLSERPRQVVEWLDQHPEAKLKELWAALLPEETPEPPKEWLVDLFWLLTQGHVLLFSDDTLVLPKRKAAQAAPAAKEGARKKKKRKPKPRIYRAKHPSDAKMIRRIERMSPSAVKRLRGPALVWKRRLEKRDRIASLIEG